MNEEQKIQYWQRFNSFQRRHEELYLGKVHAVLKSQLEQFKENGTTAAITSESMYRVLLDLYIEVGRLWAHRSDVMRRTLKARQPMGFNEKIVAYMKAYFGIDLLNDAEGITQTTREGIQQILADAAEAGWSFDEIVKRITESHLISRQRARLISRTETVAAANAGAMVNAKDTGLELNKIWIATKDNRTRPHHRNVDGNVVGLNEDFTVGVTRMSQPGDKRGGADECVNCRCCVAFEPTD